MEAAFWPHFGCLGTPFGLILAVLGRFWTSFWVSRDVLGRLFGPSWPKIAKKIDFLNFISGSGTKLGPKLGLKLAQDPPKSRPEPKKIDFKKQHIFGIDF